MSFYVRRDGITVLNKQNGNPPNSGGETVAGVDEAGRGALAGPVVAAAVVLPRTAAIEGCRDSKQLTPGRRLRIEARIKQQALAWAVAQASVEEVDSLNVLNAALLAMSRALAALTVTPDRVLVDGNRVPDVAVPAYAVVGGDTCVNVISAASILAKTARDRMMVETGYKYPDYNFAGHKGYATAEHVRLLHEIGACAVHRRSYRPVRQVLQTQSGIVKN